MTRTLLSRQFIRFLVVGGVAAAANFGSRMFFSLWLGFTAAIVLAYIVGMITAFILSRAFVFRESATPVHHSVFFFVLVNLVAVLQTWAVTWLLVFHVLPALGITWHAMEIAHASGVVVPVFSSYVGHKHLSFR